MNTGYRFVQKKTVITTTINDQLLFGAGVRVPLPIWKEHFDFLFEGTGSTVVTNLSSDTTSFEILSGFDKKFSNGLGVNLVGGAGIQKTLGTPEFRVLAGLNYKLPKSSR